jgi:hypothetical protein
MYVWSKRLIIGLLASFSVLVVVFLLPGESAEESGLKMHTTRGMALNYFGLMIWIFVWMIDQTRMRGKNLWVWLPTFLIAPLPTLMALVLFLQRRVKPIS